MAYQAAITAADNYRDSKTYPEAISKYQEASSIKPQETYPPEQITLIEGLMAEIVAAIANKEAAYQAAITAADNYRDNKTYPEAISKYQEASSIKPEETYPPEQITIIEGILAEIADKEALYAELIRKGDVNFESEEYQVSLDQFKQAQLIKPQETYPPEKIKQIEALLLAGVEKDRLYLEAITEADNARDAKAYTIALQKYADASAIKPNKDYPKEQIALIQAMLDSQLEKENAYDQAIATANQNFDSQKWQEALSFYNKALSVKPTEVYPQDRIQEIEKILQQIAEKNAAYDKAIAEADVFYEEENWQLALEKYQLAALIKPTEKYPQERVAELQSILGDLAAAHAQYNALITEADALFDGKQYVESRSKYQSALLIKANEAYPKEQITRINELVAAQKAMQGKYDAFIAEADAFYEQKEWQSSINKYQAALSIFSDKNYPKEQIQLINQYLNDMQNQQEAYDALIQEADLLFREKDYSQALTKYESASNIFPSQVYPKQKMQEIRDILASLALQETKYQGLIDQADQLFVEKSYESSREIYQKAVAIYTDRKYPKEQIVKINGLLDKMNSYNQYVASADAAFSVQKYQDALINYKSAQQLFPTEEYPPQKITEIEAILKAASDETAAYNVAISKADMRFDSKEFALAKDNYLEAKQIKPEESYPSERILEIDKLLEDLARQQMQYNKLIEEADAALATKTYDLALNKYTAALDVIPEELYPQQKIEEIRAILIQLADQQSLYDNFVAQGDQSFKASKYQVAIDLFIQAKEIFPNETYPPKRIAAAQKELDKLKLRIDVAYQKAIDEGERNFGSKKWEQAKTAYQQASEIKPEELYPKEKLAEINSILENERMKKQKEYDRYIADGERFYGTKYYQEAILSFEKALYVFPFEKYPAEMIDKIFELIKKNSMVNILGSKVTISHNNEEKFNFDPLPYKDRKESFVLLEIKKLNPEQKVKLYVNFGTNNSQNGGYSFHLRNKEGYNSYFVNIGRQVRWVNKDNNYLSILPEGGDVEVKLIKISRNGI